MTNRQVDPEELVWWSRQRCGKGEEVHSVLKEDLAGGRLPSGLFGANAAWWAITALAFNLNSAMKQLALGGEWDEQTAEGGALWDHQPSGAGGPPRQDTDHQPEPGPPLIPGAGRGAAENPRLGPRAAGDLTGPHQIQGTQVNQNGPGGAPWASCGLRQAEPPVQPIASLPKTTQPTISNPWAAY